MVVKEKDEENWFTWLQLGLVTFIDKDYERAEQMLERSLRVAPSPWTLYALAILNRDSGNHKKEVECMMQAWNLMPHDISLAKATLRCLYENQRFAKLKEVYESMPQELQDEPRCKVYYAFSLVDEGNTDGAEAILYIKAKDGLRLDILIKALYRVIHLDMD